MVKDDRTVKDRGAGKRRGDGGEKTGEVDKQPE